MPNLELTPSQWHTIHSFLRERSAPLHWRRNAMPTLHRRRTLDCPLQRAVSNAACGIRQIGTPSTDAMPTGATAASGPRSTSAWPMTRTPNASSSTVPSSAPILTPPAPLKRGRPGRPGVRTQSRRVQYQSAHHHSGRAGQSFAVHPDGRPGTTLPRPKRCCPVMSASM